MPAQHIPLRRACLALSAAATVAACGDLGPPDGEETYSQAIWLVQDGTRDTMYVQLEAAVRRGNGVITEVELWIGGLLDAVCAVSAYESTGADEHATCGWDAGTADLVVAHGVTASRCSRNGSEIPCPPRDVLSIEPGDLSFRDADDRLWYNGTPFWDVRDQ